MSRMFTFVGGTTGDWKIVSMETVTGAPWEEADRLQVFNRNLATLPEGGNWMLHGSISNQRYTTRREREQLALREPGLGRPEASCAALILLRKNETWWELAQDERREIFEGRSFHIQLGMRHLPAIARQLYHSRDLDEPFDFLTWFEYSPADIDEFDELLVTLRETEEWAYVDREIDIRLTR